MILLHAGDAALRTARVEWPILLAGVLALLVVLATIWAPPRSRSLVRRALRSTAPPLVSVVVALALLPSIFPYDHLLIPASHHEGDEQVHASHCHATPWSCSDAPVPSGPGQYLDAAPLVVVPAMLAMLIAVAVPMLSGLSWRPEAPPPLRLRAS